MLDCGRADRTALWRGSLMSGPMLLYCAKAWQACLSRSRTAVRLPSALRTQRACLGWNEIVVRSLSALRAPRLVLMADRDGGC